MTATGTKAAVARTFDVVSSVYDTVGPAYFARFGVRLVKLSGLRPGMRVLDVGCGAGAALLPAAELVGAGGHVLGIDLAEQMVRRTRAAIAERGWSHAEVRVGDAEVPDLPDADRDCVLASQVLFFLPDLARALHAYQRILRPGGIFAFTSWGPDERRWTDVYRALFGQIPEGRAPNLTPSGEAFGSDERISAMLSGAGFTGVRHTVEVYDMIFEGPGQWLAWSRSHGAWAYWEAIPPDRLDAARRVAVAALESLRDSSGTITMPTTVRYTVATRD